MASTERRPPSDQLDGRQKNPAGRHEFPASIDAPADVPELPARLLDCLIDVVVEVTGQPQPLAASYVIEAIDRANEPPEPPGWEEIRRRAYPEAILTARRVLAHRERTKGRV